MVAAMRSNAQTLYMLPVSLFGMAVSAAELPEMSSATGDEAARAEHPASAAAGRAAPRRVPAVLSAVAFIAIGGPIVALLFQSGRFSAADTLRRVDHLLAGAARNSAYRRARQGRLLGSAFYALRDRLVRRCHGAALVLRRDHRRAGMGVRVAAMPAIISDTHPEWGSFPG